jgi:hypothetical protein
MSAQFRQNCELAPYLTISFKKWFPRGRWRAAMPQRKTRTRAGQRWSSRVTSESDALDLRRRVFTWRNPKRIARSLKHSAEHSKRRKARPFQSATSMLNFYINRAGRNLPAERQHVLARAKDELRRLFGR